MDKIRFIFLGGQDETFKNMNAIEINNDIFVIEAGFKFPDKTKPGVDFIIPRFDYLLQNKDKIRGYFLTHGYDSVIGALPYIYEKCPAPIFCSRTTNDFLKGFCIHNKLDYKKLTVNIVTGQNEIVISNRKISFFGVSSNFADSIGICIDTDQGNIVYMSNSVQHNDFENGFIFDKRRIAHLTEKKTLVLLLDATNADKPGYCSPFYKLRNFLSAQNVDIPKRIFLAIDRPNLYNIVDSLNFCLEHGRKIIPYDESSCEIINILNEEGYLKLQRDSLASLEDVNRLRPQDVLVFITGHGAKLNSKIQLLAARNNDEKIVFLNKNDLFIYGAHVLPEVETSTTETIDELYKTECKVIKPNLKQYLRMHACEEDAKSFLSIFQPKYLIPISASYVKLLALAKVALGMNIGFNHNNIFIVDNGNIVEFEAGIGKVSSQTVISGDVFIDGKGLGDIGSAVLEERQTLSDEGVIVLGATISRSKREIVAGPDVQARGLVFLKENESLIREITRLFITTINGELAKESYSIAYIEEATKDIVFKAIRRAINKTPVIIPFLTEIN